MAFFSRQSIQATLQGLLHQGFTQACHCCQRSTPQAVCRDCWRQILACQQLEPSSSTAKHSPLLAWGHYQGALKRAIAQLKYQNQSDLGRLLGEELGIRWLESFPHFKSFQVVPIPLHPERLAQRGYNQAELIARRFSQVVDVPCLNQGLVRTRSTQAQHQLTPQARRQNLQGAFALGPALQKYQQRRSPILLIDDIFTTGTTIAEAQQILEQAQYKVLGSAVIAQASLRSG